MCWEDLRVVVSHHKTFDGPACWLEMVGVTETYIGLPLAGKPW